VKKGECELGEWLGAKKGECELGEWLGAKKGGPPLVEVGRILMEAQGREWEDEKTG
jgi:hypothetical protein